MWIHDCLLIDYTFQMPRVLCMEHQNEHGERSKSVHFTAFGFCISQKYLLIHFLKMVPILKRFICSERKSISMQSQNLLGNAKPLRENVNRKEFFC